jgi:hypothetical protein
VRADRLEGGIRRGAHDRAEFRGDDELVARRFVRLSKGWQRDC